MWFPSNYVKEIESADESADSNRLGRIQKGSIELTGATVGMYACSNKLYAFIKCNLCLLIHCNFGNCYCLYWNNFRLLLDVTGANSLSWIWWLVGVPSSQFVGFLLLFLCFFSGLLIV